jgi:hypothetical protein
MIYTADRPPVIKASLGSTPWPTISTVKPWIEYVVIKDDTAVLSEGDALVLTGTDPHLLTQIANTPIWIHKFGNFYTTPETGLELAYYITNGDGGSIVEEGTVFISSNDTVVAAGTVVSTDFIIPSGIEIPSSAGATKDYPVKFIPYGASGAIQSLDHVNITVTPVGELAIINAVSMTDNSGVWEYDWSFSYGGAEKIYSVRIDAHLDNSGTNFVSFHRVVETFKRKEYNPQRIKQGVVS